ncbi:MAG: GTP pyrophosphokinase [Acidobacteria bacterium]|jgi:ppGpp synthetase/RelA/SpoT-type nucleotidyltranferase|nr:GTP pyrophosphokinase [Acidobacteriota bacterium]
MSKLNTEEHKKWYESQRPTYELLSNAVKNTLESLINNSKIDYLSVTIRTKEVDSFEEKINRKNYQNPAHEVTDLAGIRVITFIESDALKINELIKQSFNVDDSKSLDKSNELGIDKFGYRSFHFVCGLGEARCALPEFEFFKDLVCEIQVRTVLQHAWAEIEHDRNYKFAGDLPSHIKRRLNLVAGLLEVADGEFNNLSNDIDKYSVESLRKTKSGDFDIEINSITIEQYLKESEIVEFVIQSAVEAGFSYTHQNRYTSLIKVCNYLNIFTIESIDNILKSSRSWVKPYLTNVWKACGSSPWLGYSAFYIMIIIIAANIKKIKRNQLLEFGWSASKVDCILDAAKVVK